LVIGWRTGRLAWSVPCLVSATASLCLLGTSLRAVTPAIQLQELLRQLPATAEFASYRYGEPSLVFYSARHWESLSKEPELKEFLARPGPRIVVCQERDVRVDDRWRKVARRGAGTLPDLSDTDYQRVDLQGLNIARTSWVYLRVYYRR
jgi:hypothetical protein